MDQIGIFAKYWEPGQVKTRLAAAIGAEAASRVYRAFLGVLLPRVYGLAEHHVLAYWPPWRRDSFAHLAGREWVLLPQCEGDLGTRIKHFFGHALARGARRVVLLGSDSPTVPTEHLRNAFRLLDDVPIVLGPTDDGGYYLVGIRQIMPPVFENIDWSTPHVWEQTLAQIRRLDLRHAQLPMWRDVDRIEDLRRLRDELSQLVVADGGWSSLLATVREALGQGSGVVTPEP